MQRTELVPKWEGIDWTFDAFDDTLSDLGVLIKGGRNAFRLKKDATGQFSVEALEGAVMSPCWTDCRLTERGDQAPKRDEENLPLPPFSIENKQRYFDVSGVVRAAATDNTRCLQGQVCSGDRTRDVKLFQLTDVIEGGDAMLVLDVKIVGGANPDGSGVGNGSTRV
jgi:hypothetical protein